MAVRVAVLVVPVLAAVIAATLASRLLPKPESGLVAVLWWLAVIAVSTLVLLAVDRQARRLLPLAMLYKLTLLFPDQAPSRFRVALRGGTVRRLEERLEQSRRNGVGHDPAQAAANILVLVAALSRHDRRTRGHSERVRGFTDLLAEEMRLTGDEADRLRWAALLHDIGKVQVRSEILNKSDSLTPQEWAVIHRHPSDGARMAAPLRPWLGPWMDAIEQHHERWDGAGYPNGLSGTDISLSARIVAVADAFEVMTAPRSYRRPLGPAAARDELARCAGSHFDPAVVRALLNISIGRLRWVMAPITWLADLPFVRPVARAGPVAESAAAGTAAKTILAVSLAVFGGTVAEVPPASPAEGVASVQQPERAPDPVVLAGTSSSAGAVSPPPPSAPATTSTTSAPVPARGPATAAPPAAPPARRNAGGGPPTRPGNPGPAAGDDVAPPVGSGKPVKISVLANDTDPDGLDEGTLSVVSGPAHGTANVTGPPTQIRYKAANGYVGMDSFRYRICDTKGACSTATVWVNVVP